MKTHPSVYALRRCVFSSALSVVPLVSRSMVANNAGLAAASGRRSQFCGIISVAPSTYEPRLERRSVAGIVDAVAGRCLRAAAANTADALGSEAAPLLHCFAQLVHKIRSSEPMLPLSRSSTTTEPSTEARRRCRLPVPRSKRRLTEFGELLRNYLVFDEHFSALFQTSWSTAVGLLAACIHSTRRALCGRTVAFVDSRVVFRFRAVGRRWIVCAIAVRRGVGEQ